MERLGAPIDRREKKLPCCQSSEFRVYSSLHNTANRLSWPYKPCLANAADQEGDVGRSAPKGPVPARACTGSRRREGPHLRAVDRVSTVPRLRSRDLPRRAGAGLPTFRFHLVSQAMNAACFFWPYACRDV